jgi:hypothetical protein
MVVMKLVPMYWTELGDDILYRIHTRDGIHSPEWFTPTNSSRLIAHDTVHHLQYEDCGYGLDAYADAHANELLATGVAYSSELRGRDWHVNNSLHSFLSNMPKWNEDKDCWSGIPIWAKCSKRDEFIDRYFSSDNPFRTEDKDKGETHSSVIRALSILRRGIEWGDSLSNIEYLRYEIENNLRDVLINAAEQDYPNIIMEYDFDSVRLSTSFEYRDYTSTIELWTSDCNGC